MKTLGCLILFLAVAIAQDRSTGATLSFQCKTWNSPNVIISQNVVWGMNVYCNKTGITINGAESVIIEENYFLQSFYGITITGAASVIINRNTFAWFMRGAMEFIYIDTAQSATVMNNIFFAVPQQSTNRGGDLTTFVRIINTAQTTIQKNWFWYGSGRNSILIDSNTIMSNVIGNYFYGSLIGLNVAARRGTIANNTFVSRDGRTGSGAILFQNGCNYQSLETNMFKWTDGSDAPNVNAAGGSECIPDTKIDRSLMPYWDLLNGMGARPLYAQITTPPPNPACTPSDLIVSFAMAGSGIGNEFPILSLYANVSGVIRQFSADGGSFTHSPTYTPSRYNFRLSDVPTVPTTLFFNWTGDGYWGTATPQELTLDVNLYLVDIIVQGQPLDLNTVGCDPAPLSARTGPDNYKYWVSEENVKCQLWEGVLPVVAPALPGDCAEDSGDLSPVYIGIGVGFGILIFAGLGILVFVFLRRRRQNPQRVPEQFIHMTNYTSPGGSLAATIRPESMGEDSTLIKYKDLRLIEKVGEGGFGIVWKAKWKGITVAVKQLKQFESLGTQHVDEFMREAELMRTMRPNPNVVTYFGISTDKLMCIVTEFLDGGSVKSWLKSNVVTVNGLKTMMRDIATGMAHLEAQKIVHKDLAARNVLLTSGLTAKVSDFGLSRVSTSGENNTVFTSAEVGPVKWMPPESLVHRKFTSKSDVYAYGVTCIEITTRKEPYPNIDLLQFSMRVLGEKLHLRNDVPKDVPKDLADLIVACLAETPEQRPTFNEIIVRLLDR